MLLIFLVFNAVFFIPPVIYSANLTAIKAPVDIIDITGFSQCGLTSKWFRSQFSPFLKKLEEIPNGLSIVYHPLSIGSTIVNGSKIATCENGELECQLNKLQCCAKRYMENEKNRINLLRILTCIQGKSTFEHGINCLPGGEIQKKIKSCSEHLEGEFLLIAEPFPHNDSIVLPWIKINGVRNYEATKHFQSVVCSLKSMKNATVCMQK